MPGRGRIFEGVDSTLREINVILSRSGHFRGTKLLETWLG